MSREKDEPQRKKPPMRWRLLFRGCEIRRGKPRPYNVSMGVLQTSSDAGMSARQRYPHATLEIHLRGRRPVDFIGAYDAASAARELIADASVLIGVIAHRQN